MIGMVLVTHGRLAAEFVAALEHVVGAQTQIAAICIGPDDDMEERRQDILRAISEIDTGRTRYRCLALIGYGTDDANAQRARPLGEQEPNTAGCRVKEHSVVRLKPDDFFQ